MLQTANDYEKGLINGDLGWVVELDLDGGRLTVDYDSTVVDYDFTELDELLPAYAISVHRSQGSASPAVVVPVMTQHYRLLERNLLYSAVTRARRLAVLVGTAKAIGIAVRNKKVGQRHTGLAGRLASKALLTVPLWVGSQEPALLVNKTAGVTPTRLCRR